MTQTDTFTKEVGLFVASRKKTTDQENLHRAFLVIPHASVLCIGRACFSAAGIFLLKFRTIIESNGRPNLGQAYIS